MQLYADNDNIQLVREEIRLQENAYTTLKNNNERLKDRSELIEKYKSLDTLLTKSILEKEESLSKCMEQYFDIDFLLSSDSSIFKGDYPAKMHVPNSLRYHYETILKIIKLKELLEQTEQKRDRLVETAFQEMKQGKIIDDYKARVSSEIMDDVDNMRTLIREIKSRELSTLSAEQYEYFKPGLTGRYNNLIKFFE